jgi:hypothetical protein
MVDFLVGVKQRPLRFSSSRKNADDGVLNDVVCAGVDIASASLINNGA